MRAWTWREAATADAGRLLSLAPMDENGALMNDAIELARAEFAARLAETGLIPATAPAPAGAECSVDGSICHSLEVIPGSMAALGRQRSTITVWAAAKAPVTFLYAFSGETAPAQNGWFRVVADAVQVHHR